MKALGIVVSDKKIFENCILNNYFLTPWPTYATNWNSLNTFDRGLPRDHSCEVWSKSNEWFQRRSCLKKLTDGRTHQSRRTMDNGPSQKLTLSTLCSGELKRHIFKQFFDTYVVMMSHCGSTPGNWDLSKKKYFFFFCLS